MVTGHVLKAIFGPVWTKDRVGGVFQGLTRCHPIAKHHFSILGCGSSLSKRFQPRSRAGIYDDSVRVAAGISLPYCS